ncbi:putative protein prenyltransferase, alpha subunit [Rosa chinensis]|uniref:Uncharacterized protein n=1 Tax=Rosa chinensis TaxID=74649 RepID=A0A2P6RKV0_ROSCH|nr:putative protein prenyltransferase, alpha subunit [Rosa chinensis]
MVLLKKQELSILLDELVFLALVLSYAPKSEHAWSHRRWVIKLIVGKCSTLQEIVTKEFELVEKIAEVYIQFRNCVLLICKEVKNVLPCMVSSLLIGDLHDNVQRWLDLFPQSSCI